MHVCTYVHACVCVPGNTNSVGGGGRGEGGSQVYTLWTADLTLIFYGGLSQVLQVPQGGNVYIDSDYK